MSFTLEREVVSYVRESSGSFSASERVNRMLKRAIVQERYDALKHEAEEFYAVERPVERDERRAFRKATLKSMFRE